ncbi:probable LRR receptor-like serine/threonine-protein kinase At3g47570 [Rhodamnia argentea]|uniref:Probable LRR receptor-like serine/threonine-protein kinase At3g47570 n=1 Tax=Rhodamnia argentea TaxID=178133 RepID=A0A8B8QSX0_9MYRT|nr:probable LRR receptor-like serine/threonine-protein kinase At3g47570 [Rhodamnia argentea]
MDLPNSDRVLSKSFSCLTTVILLLGSVLALIEAGNEETDRLTLLEFKAQIADPGRVLSSWNDTSHFCEWYGVTCGRRHRRVTVLDLSSENLAGFVPPHIGNLSFLREVYLDNNSFHSEIAPQLSRLLRLRILFLNNNLFGGQIPSNLSHCSNLLVLNLGINRLEGNLPTELDSLSKLQIVVFQVNSLTGNIPPSFGNLSSLQVLLTSDNNLGGMIPETLGWLRNLNILTLARNKFVGMIPFSIFNISTVTMLDTAGNRLEGGLPSDLGFTLPNLERISLSDNHLSGPIPESISNASNLSEIQIGPNNFTGKVPSLSKMGGLYRLHIGMNNLGSGQSADLDFLCSLTNSTNLYSLNMGDNAFGGSIPDCIGALPTGGVFKSAISTSVVGNKKLCGGLPNFQLPKCNYKESKRMRISKFAKVLISTVSTLVGVVCMLSLLYFFWYKHNNNASTSNYSEDGLFHVSYHSLLKATSGFSSTNLLGMGSFGSVYRGLLDQTQLIVAIKILDLTRHGASKSFIAECEALRRIRHRNLVKVLTACSGFDSNGNDFKALVYEFMSNGSLDEWLHPTASQHRARTKLSLLQRVNIAIDVACAQDYLHHRYETPIVHCDLKPSNVLLDDEMTGHVGDFGLARFLPEATHKLLVHQSSSIGVKGSFGYVAPEYGSGSAISIEGDVYSFGVLVLEMFTGKRPTNDMFENGLNLHHFAKASLADQVEKVIDPILLQENQESEKRRTVAPDGKNKSWFTTLECLVSIIKIGVTCSSEYPKERMDMGDASTKLQGIRKKLVEFIVIA